MIKELLPLVISSLSLDKPSEHNNSEKRSFLAVRYYHEACAHYLVVEPPRSVSDESLDQSTDLNKSVEVMSIIG